MTVYKKIKPDERGLALSLASKALKAARGMSTANPGSLYIPNGDGTGTLIGQAGGNDAAGGMNGVAPWIGDTTPPGKPTGVSCSSAWGTLYVNWDGTLEGGVPADFAYVSVLVDGAEIARMVEAGTAVREDLENGATVQVTAVAYDAARDRNGNPAPNASEAFGPVSVQISDERAEIDAEVEKIKGEMEQAAQDAADAKEEAAEAAQAAQAASEKADSFQGQINDVTVAVNGAVQDVAELSQEVSGAVSDASQALTTATQAKQTADAISDTAQRAYENADEALTQSSSAVQTANGIVETLESDYLSKDEAGGLYATRSELERTADEISLSVEQVRDESVILDGADGPAAVIGKNAGMAPFGIDVEGLTRQNLWKTPATGNKNGIKVVQNSDGTATISGTATTGAYIAMYVYTLVAGRTYTLSVDKTVTGARGFYIDAYGENTGSLQVVYVGGTQHSALKATFTLAAGTTKVALGLGVDPGQTVSGTYRVMLNEGSEAQPWCPPGLNSVSKVHAGIGVPATGYDTPYQYAVAAEVDDPGYIVPGDKYSISFLVTRGNVYLNEFRFTTTSQYGVGFHVIEATAKDISEDASKPGCLLKATYVGGACVRLVSIRRASEGRSSTGIPLLGNRLRSLPDGTRDTLAVDSAGNVVMEKRVGIVSGASSGWSANPNFTGAKHGYSLVVADSAVYDDAGSASPMCNVLSIHQVANAEMRDHSIKHTTTSTMIARHDSCADLASWKSWLSSSVFEMLYALETPQTIPLGHVDLPELPADGAVMWVVAEDAYGNSFTLEPGSSFQWYGENAEALGEYATKAQLKVEADAIRSEVEETYQSKDGMSDYATVSSVEQTASEIESNVAATYQTKAGMSSYATNSSVTQTANSIKQEVAAEYTTKEDAQATYATKTSLQQTEDSILSSVESEYQSKDGMSSYATKSYVDQQDNSIKTTVSSVQTTANNALSKASTVEQTAEGLEVTLTSTTTTANNALKRVTLSDTRDTNQNPQWYFTNCPKQMVHEFKTKSAIGLSSASGAYVYLTTYVPWTDSSGGWPKQTAKVDGTGKEYWRVGTSSTTWSAWCDALGTAQTAQTTATNAAKTATNYLKFDSAGLCVGNQTTTLGYNTLIKSGGVDIRNGSTTLASYSASEIKLGNNSNNSRVTFGSGYGHVGIDPSNYPAMTYIDSSKGGKVEVTQNVSLKTAVSASYGSKTILHAYVYEKDSMIWAEHLSGNTYSQHILSVAESGRTLWSGTMNVGGSATINNLDRWRSIGLGVPLGFSNNDVEAYVICHFMGSDTLLFGIGGGATQTDGRIAFIRLGRSGDSLSYLYGRTELIGSGGTDNVRVGPPIRTIVGIC